MKKTLIAIAAVVAISLTGSASLSAQSGLGGLLKNITGNSTVKNVIESVTGISLNASIVGNWDFKGSAIALSGEDVTANLAATAAASTLAGQIDPYLAKVGITPGAFKIGFAADSSFAIAYGDKIYSGTYTINGSDITMSFAKGIKLPKISGTASVTSDNLQILFKANSLLKFLKKLTAATSGSNQTIATINTVIKNYSGMKLGFDLTKIK